MKQVWVRPAEPKDAQQFVEWANHSKEINLFDPDVMTYPTTVTLLAHTDEPLMYMPFQAAVVMESLAPRPGLSPLEEALALREITKHVVHLGRVGGFREAYFICKDERVVEFAKKHGFEEIPHKVMRLKFNSLEKAPSNDAK